MELIDFLLRQIIFRNPQRDCRIRGSAEDWEGLPPTKVCSILRKVWTSHRRFDIPAVQ